jgi:hypothetical protein
LFRIGDELADDERCVKHVARTGLRCKNGRRSESTLCRAHGSAGHIQNAVQRRQAEKVARLRAIEKYKKEGPAVITGPEDVIALLEERMSVQVQMARGLDDMVERLAAADEMRYEHRAGEQLRGEMQAWIQVNQMVTKLGADYLKIGLNERKVVIAEAQAKILIGVIQAVLGRLELSRDQKRIAAQVVPEELQRAAIEGGR